MVEREYHLLAARREADGMVSPALLDVPLRAASLREAVARAREHEFGPEAAEANVVWLTDPDGAIVWSLRREG